MRYAIIAAGAAALSAHVAAQEADSSASENGLAGLLNDFIQIDNTDSSEIKKDELLGALDLAVPENPLFVLMGSTPETVIKPKAGDKFSASFAPEVIDAFGNENYSFAVEVNPSQYIIPEYFTFSEFSGTKSDGSSFNSDERKRRDQLATAKWLEPLNLTLIANRSTGNLNKVQVGFGASYVLDSGAPLRKQNDYVRCLQDYASDTSKIISESETFLELRSAFNAEYDEIRIGLLAVVVASYLHSSKTVSDPEQNQKLVRLRAYFNNSKEGDEANTRQVLEARFRGNNLDATIAEGRLPNIDQSTLETDIQAAVANSQSYKNFDRVSQEIAQNCAEEVRPWNRNVYGFGAAVYHTDIDESPILNGVTPSAGNGDDAKDVTGGGIWGSASLISPFDRTNGQIVVSARITENLVREREIDGEKQSEEVDGLSVGGRYVHQFSASANQKNANARAIRGFAEFAYSEEEFGDATDEFWQAGVGAEIQIRKDLFFQFVIGDTFGSDIDRSTYLSGQLKWSFSKIPLN